MNQLAIGFHDGEGGGRVAPDTKGYFEALNAAGIPFLAKKVGSMPFDGQEIARKNPNIPNMVVYRGGGGILSGYDTPDYSLPATESAKQFWAKHKATIPPELDPKIVWIETLNEIAPHFDIDTTHLEPSQRLDWNFMPSKYPPHDDRTLSTYERDGQIFTRIDNAGWFGRFAGITAQRMNDEGYKWLAYGFSSGEPEPEFWRHPYVANFLRYAARNQDRCGLALHEYSYTIEKIMDADRSLVGRFVEVVDFVKNELGEDGITIVMTEWGWTLNNVPSYDTFKRHLQEVTPLYLQHGVKGLALWHVGAGEWGGLQGKLASYEPMLRQDILSGEIQTKMASIVEPPPVDPPVDPEEPPVTDELSLFPPYRITHLLHPTYDKMTAQQVSIIQNWLKSGIPNQLLYGSGSGTRSVGFAGWTHQDPIDALHRSLLMGEDDSLVVVVDGDQIGTGLNSQWVEDNFPHLIENFVFVTTMEPEPDEVQIELENWPLVASKQVTQGWGENPQIYMQYGLPGHEGIDVGAPIGSGVHTVAPGVVVHASPYRMSGGGLSAYGYHVVVDHGGWHSLYGHLKAGTLPKVGNILQSRESLGLIGFRETSVENTTGPHLHFSILVRGYPDNGYLDTRFGRYVDPTPYLTLNLPYPQSGNPNPNPGGSYTGPAMQGEFVWGLDQPASDWDWARGRQVFDQTGLTPKFHTGGNNHQWFGMYKGDGFNIVRILLNPAFQGNAQEIFNEIRSGVDSYYSMGQRDFILFNEPNLRSEGLGIRYVNGIDYANLVTDIAKMLKEGFPGIRLWFSPMSPSGDGSISGDAFLTQVKEAGGFQQFYGITEHVYTGIANNVEAAVEQVVSEVRAFQKKWALNKPLVIGEFSVNRPASADYKSAVYRRLYEEFSSIDGLQAAYSFTSTWYGGQESGSWGRTWDTNLESWLEHGIRVSRP